ncbi:MAG: hypothetical protein IT179_07935 [Acidobacteria bacterium]|nr:hypothetical protein [Acidobacteriota bacterium]
MRTFRQRSTFCLVLVVPATSSVAPAWGQSQARIAPAPAGAEAPRQTLQ